MASRGGLGGRAAASRCAAARRWIGSLLVLAAPTLPGAPAARAEHALAAGSATGRLTLAVGGDVMFGRITAGGYRAHGGASPFGPWSATLAGADVAFVNLETGICDEGRTAGPLPLLWAPPERLDALREAGIDVVSVANNHALDCGADGLAATLTELERRGVRAAGVAPAGVVSVTDEVVFLAATLHPAPHRATGSRPLYAPDGRGLVARVRAMRAAEGDRLLVVSLHWGRERAVRPAAAQRALGQALIAAGANAVVGHGSHTRQPVERVGDGVVVYGLGNLVFDDRTPLARPRAPVLLRFQRTARGFVFVGLGGE